jgi:chaperone required for assembly of F1-ATPase
MKRLYKDVTVAEAPEGFSVLLDGRAVKTPGRFTLVVPTRALAEAVAEEWRAQEALIRPDTMPLMQLAATALDHIPSNRASVESVTLRFIDTDTICYRADGPPSLIELQQTKWEPLLDWLAQCYGVSLVKVSGVLPVSQSWETIEILARAMQAMDNWHLCPFQSAVASSGSFVIALALVGGRIDAAEAFEAAELESSFEIGRWGVDPIATARRATVASDLAAARRFSDLLNRHDA